MLPLAWMTEGAVRIVLGSVFVLFLPGYALVAALYPLRRSVDTIERLALSFGTSIAVVPLIGLGLNYTTWGIRLTPVMLSVLAFNVTMCAVAAYRRSKVPRTDRFSVSFRFPRLDWQAMALKERVITGVLIASIAFAAGSIIFVITAPREGERFTEFYILGLGGMATGYPDEIALGDSARLVLGIANHEGQPLSYTIEGRLDGSPDALAVSVVGPLVEAVDDSTFVVQDLADEAEWESIIEVRPLVAGDGLKAELLLFSPRLRTDTHLRASLGEAGYVQLVVDEQDGKANVTVSPGDQLRHECRIEAWQDAELVAIASFVVEEGGARTHEFTFPPAETAFRVYDGDSLVLNDCGEELSVHLWIDVPQGSQAG